MRVLTNRRSAGEYIVVLCADCAETGEVYIPSRCGWVVFTDIIQFTALLDADMDAQQYPRRSHKPRTWKHGGGGKSAACVPTLPTRCVDGPAFYLQITSRRDATWQGRLQPIDGGDQRYPFTCVLDLFKLMRQD